MANIKDCPGFETFGADVKEARKVKQLSRKTLAEQVNIDWRYLANIENDGTIPSLPVIIQLIKECGLPVERYFNPEIMREESPQRQRVFVQSSICRSSRARLTGLFKSKIQRRKTKRGMCESILCFPFYQRAARLSDFFAFFQKNFVFCGQLDVFVAF